MSAPIQSPTPRPGEGWSAARPAVWLTLVLVSCAVYLPALRNGFVWDDTALVLRDPLIRSWVNLADCFGHFLFLDATGSQFYRPIQRVTYLWDYAWFGFAPAGWHATNILLHAGAALALCAFARRFLHRLGTPAAGIASFGAALVWAVHPIHSSAVIYVAGRADSLAALFGFLALWIALGRDRPIMRAFSAGLALLVAGLSKESGLWFGPAWLALMWLAPSPRHGRITALASVCAVALVYALLRQLALATPTPPAHPPELAARLGLAFQAVGEYAGLLALPLRLTMERDLREADGALLRIVGGCAAVAFLAWCWIHTRRRPEGAAVHAALALAALAYLPISGVFPLNANCAEHWLYVPSAWLAIAGAALCGGITFRPGSVMRYAAFAILAAWTLALGVRTWMRCPDWRDSATFFRTTIATADTPDRMRMNLATLMFRESDRDAAVALQTAVLSRHPGWHQGRISLAAMLLAMGRTDAAEAELERVREVTWLQTEHLELAGVAALARGDRAGAERHLREGLEIAPRSWALQRRLTRLLAEGGDPARATTGLAGWMQASGGEFRAESWVLLADAAAAAGRPDLAANARKQAHARDVRLSTGAQAPH
jgi:hypothetical protein